MKDNVSAKDQICFLLNGKPVAPIPEDLKKREEELMKELALLLQPKK